MYNLNDEPIEDLLFDSLDISHETVIKVVPEHHWLREVNQFIDKHVDYDREMSYIDDIDWETDGLP